MQTIQPKFLLHDALLFGAYGVLGIAAAIGETQTRSWQLLLHYRELISRFLDAQHHKDCWGSGRSQLNLIWRLLALAKQQPMHWLLAVRHILETVGSAFTSRAAQSRATGPVGVLRCWRPGLRQIHSCGCLD